MLRVVLALLPGAIPFEANQAEDCTQNDQSNKRVQDRPGVLGKNVNDGRAVDVGSVADGEVPDRSSYAECSKEIPVRIVQGARNKQNWLGWKRRRQQGGDGHSGKAVHFEMLIQLFRSVVKEARRVEKLRADHPIESFDCREELNRYLLRSAWQNQQAGVAQTYVALAGDSAIGYYTLAVGHMMREEAPERLTKGLARHPVPIMWLARLAIDHRWHGQGVGKALLKDAMLRTLQAADIAGTRAFAVRAKKTRRHGAFT